MDKILFEDGNIHYQQLTEDKLKEAIEIGRKSFFADETVCKALDLKNNKTAMDELEELFIKVAEDGVSIVAIDVNVNRIVAVTFNKLHLKSQPDIDYYEKYSNRCRDPASKSFLSFMKGTDLIVDMFELCKADSYLEIMFLGVLSTYRGKSIAFNLCRASETLARTLCLGRNVKQSINAKPLSLEPVPKFISAIFTSPVSQKIGQKMDMQVAASIKLDLWFYKEQTFAERLGNDVAPIQYRYKMLNSM